MIEPDQAAETPTFPKIRKRRKGPYAADECGNPPRPVSEGDPRVQRGRVLRAARDAGAWRATESDIRYLYQGVLLIGVAFYHQQQNNYHGTQAKLSAGIEMLEWFAPACQTVDVADLIAKAKVCLGRSERSDASGSRSSTAR